MTNDALPIIRVDFQNSDENGDVRLNTVGTMLDLASKGVVLREGMVLRLVDAELASTGRVRWGKEGLWVAVVDWNEVIDHSDEQLAPVDIGSSEFGLQPFTLHATTSGNQQRATTSYRYDGTELVHELSGETPTANPQTFLGIDEDVSRTDSNGTRAFLTGALGSTVALTDTTGAV